MTRADQAANNIDYLSKEVLRRIKSFRAMPKKHRRVSLLKARIKDLAYWAEYLIPLLNELTPEQEEAPRRVHIGTVSAGPRLCALEKELVVFPCMCGALNSAACEKRVGDQEPSATPSVSGGAA